MPQECALEAVGVEDVQPVNLLLADGECIGDSILIYPEHVIYFI